MNEAMKAERDLLEEKIITQTAIVERVRSEDDSGIADITDSGPRYGSERNEALLAREEKKLAELQEQLSWYERG